jgi:mono/diheme cytochrome c family protein
MKFYKKYFSTVLSIIFVLFTVTNCDDSLTVEDVDKKDIPSSNVSFADHIYPVFQVKCINCHNATSPDAGLDLTSYAAATSSLDMIFPGSADVSRLVWSIEARSGVSPMPPIGYPILTKDQIDGIKTWINEGAKNN